MTEVCYVSTVFKEPQILQRFVEHIVRKIDDDCVCLIYCHDVETYNMCDMWDHKNIVFIRGLEDIFYTEAINIMLKIGVADYGAKQFCILDSDCFVSDNFNEVIKMNIGKAGIFRNMDISSNALLPAGFVIRNRLVGRAVDVESLSNTGVVDKIDYSNGRGLFFPANSLAAIGYLNEDFPIYGSDNEFSYRLGKYLGLNYIRDAIVYSFKHETGDNVLVKDISWKKRLYSLWSKRSSSNLKTRLLFCWYVAPNSLLFLLWALRSCSNALIINVLGRRISRFTNYR